MIMNKIVETSVKYEENIIIFSEVSEDPWQEGRYYMMVAAYRPMLLADGSIVRHPFAYENADAYQFAKRRQFGFTSFNEASTFATLKVEQYMSRFGVQDATHHAPWGDR
jgi:hypothetical protein